MICKLTNTKKETKYARLHIKRKLIFSDVLFFMNINFKCVYSTIVK
jgi:uncharacterized Fe-S radical SAM superfamily protein PflX